MSVILTTPGFRTVQCDECGDTLSEDFDLDDFLVMVGFAKQEGWTIRPDGHGGWMHRCPDCRPSSLAEQRRLLGR
jgi:hypothetical protein